MVHLKYLECIPKILLTTTQISCQCQQNHIFFLLHFSTTNWNAIHYCHTNWVNDKYDGCLYSSSWLVTWLLANLWGDQSRAIVKRRLSKYHLILTSVPKHSASRAFLIHKSNLNNYYIVKKSLKIQFLFWKICKVVFKPTNTFLLLPNS